MKIIQALKKVHEEYLLFRDECVEAQIVAIRRVCIFALIYSLVAPVLLLLFVTDSVKYVVTQYVALVIVAGIIYVCIYFLNHLDCFKGDANRRRRTNYGESIYFLSCIFLIAWGNLSLGLTYRETGKFDILVWFVIYLIVATMSTLMPYEVFIINILAQVATIIQIYRLSGSFVDRQILYHVIMFAFFISIIMVDKYRYALESFKRARNLEEQRLDRERFVVNMTHEMRTPLNAVLGKNNIVLNDTKEQETLKLAKEINSSGKILLTLISDILDFSKMEAGKMTVSPVDYSTEAISYEVADIMRSDAIAKGLGFKLEVSTNMPARLYGDDVRIRQIIMNLLSNAIKYTKEGSVTLRMWFEYNKPAEKTGRLFVAVIDTGIGIREEDIPKLTKAFSRVDDEKTRNIQGTGLGLAICASLLKLMGSELKVESTYEIGSTFYFSVEQKVIDEASLRKNICEKKASDIAYFEAPLAKVLVVDDNKVNFSVCKGLMKYYGFTPDYADRGEKALKMIRLEDYDIVFIDHLMPEMSGIDTLKRIESDYPDKYSSIPFIALTANESKNSEEEYKSMGFADYLAKPIDEHKLFDILNKYIPKEKRI